MDEKINQFLVCLLVISIVAFPVYGVFKLLFAFNDLFAGNELLFEYVNENETYKIWYYKHSRVVYKILPV